jgi:hypothetical protein
LLAIRAWRCYTHQIFAAERDEMLKIIDAIEPIDPAFGIFCWCDDGDYDAASACSVIA